MVRGFALPAGEWDIKDTWHAVGLRGTGSHHIELKDVVVPEDNFFDLETGVPCVPGPLYEAARQVLPLSHGAFSIGVAEGALDELVALAKTGRQQTGRHADAGLRDIPVRAWPCGSRSESGEGLSSGSACRALASPAPLGHTSGERAPSIAGGVD